VTDTAAAEAEAPTVEEVVGLVMAVDPATVTDASAINDVPNWDRFQHQVLLQVLEQTYDVKFADAAEVSSVGEIKAFIGDKGKG
jgi:hypothetical protein